jgi:hypothetical protein
MLTGRLACPLRAGQALTMRSLCPVRPHVRADYPAFGADRFRAQIPDSRIIRPAIGINRPAVVAVEPVAAVDQQPPDPMRAHVPERDRRASIGVRTSLRRRIVVGAQAYITAGCALLPEDCWEPLRATGQHFQASFVPLGGVDRSKLLIALWRLVTTGEVPDDVELRPAA